MPCLFWRKMDNKRKHCLACGKEYTYCPRCDGDNKTPWMRTFDCPACRDIVNAVSGFNMGILKLTDVKDVLEKYKIEDVSVYNAEIKDVLLQAKKPATKVKNVDVELEEKKDIEAKPTKSIFTKGMSK